MKETDQDERSTLTEAVDTPTRTGTLFSVVAQGAVTRWRHRRLLRWVLPPVGVAVVVVGVTAALLAASAGPAPTALAVVTSALAKTSADSYRFSLESTVRVRGRQRNFDMVSGAFDPRHGLGTELLATREDRRPVTAQVRFIGRYVYTRVSGLGTVDKPWNKAPLPSVAADGIPPGYEVYGFVTDRPISPAELSGVLRSAGTVRDEGPGSGPGWTGTRYAFTARFPETHTSVTGTVYVDQRGRARRLVTVTAQGDLTTNRNLTFGDLGAPVRVIAPSASQVKYTSRPYWGFLF